MFGTPHRLQSDARFCLQVALLNEFEAQHKCRRVYASRRTSRRVHILGIAAFWFLNDLVIVSNLVLSWSQFSDSNRGPTVYKTVALPLS